MLSFVRHLAFFRSRSLKTNMTKAEPTNLHGQNDASQIAHVSASCSSSISKKPTGSSESNANINSLQTDSNDERDIAAKAKPTRSSTKDSGYGSESDMDNKKLRQLRARFSNKCKRIWHGASNAVRKKDSARNETYEEVHEEENGNDGENDDEASEDEEEEDTAHPRCDFKTIEAIEDDALKALVLLHCNTGDEDRHAEVVRRCKGAYNFAAIIKISCGDETHAYVARIPGHATLSHWTPEDEYMMEREAQLITHIRNNTSAPVPEVITYSTTHDNALGFPHILMTALPGKPASSIWYDGDYDNDDMDLVIQHADMPTTATEKKRITFLRSLARVMAEINTLSFTGGGMAIFTDDGPPTFGPMYFWGTDGSDLVHKRKPFRWTTQYAYIGLVGHLIGLGNNPTEASSGTQKFFNLIFQQDVFKVPKPETFTIHHNDLDLQNILVDEDGNVTGIIDWDGAFIAPRCMGAAAAPLFLRKDWMPEHLNNLDTSPHMAWKTPYYREIYAAVLTEAGCADAMYTTKSPIYSAALLSVQEVTTSSMVDLIDKLLRKIPHVRVKSADFRRALGTDWKDAEDMLMVELAKVMEPELPRADLLEDVDAEMALKEWYLAFNMEEDEQDDADTEDKDDDGDGEDEDDEAPA